MMINMLILNLLNGLFFLSQNIYEVKDASIKFDSDAPLELIKAENHNVKGLIDPDNKSFAFLAPMASFEGFNSPLQQTHFNENYLETDKFPKARFYGKIQGEFNLDTYGTYNVLGKGTFNIHGIAKKI